MKCPNCGRSDLMPIEGSGFRLRCTLCQDLCTKEEALYAESMGFDDLLDEESIDDEDDDSIEEDE